jgi:hypothetical protein
MVVLFHRLKHAPFIFRSGVVVWRRSHEYGGGLSDVGDSRIVRFLRRVFF